MDVRPGGHQRFTMVSDDDSFPPAGPVHGRYDEVIENELLVRREDLGEPPLR